MKPPESRRLSTLAHRDLVTNNGSRESCMPDFSDASQWELLSSCMLCGESRLQLWSTARDRHYGIAGTFSVMKCESCGLCFLNPMPSIGYLASAYPANYYAYNAPLSSAKSQRLQERVKTLLKELLYFHPGATKDPPFSRPGRILDVGSGNGFFLIPMRRKGWEVHGVEPDISAAERGRQEGLDIFAGQISEAHYPSKYFDYIRSNHSFEHIQNPREVLREMRRVIKPTGLLFIGVPNVKGLMARLFGTYWWYLGAPVHTFGYNPESLGMLLAQEGFKVVKTNFNSTYAGIFGSLQIYLNRHNGKMSEAGHVVHNPALMVLGHWAARLTDLLRIGDCIEIIARPE